jgi:hypothetical protein
VSVLPRSSRRDVALLPAVKPGESAGTRVAGYSIPDHLRTCLAASPSMTGSSPADPPRRAFSAYRVGVQGFLRSISRFQPCGEPERPIGFPGYPCPSPCGGVRCPNRPRSSGLRRGLDQPALVVRIFDGVIFRKPPPHVQIPRGSFRPGHLAGALAGCPKCSPVSLASPRMNSWAGLQQVPFRSFRSRLAAETGCSGPRTFGRTLDPSFPVPAVATLRPAR